MIGKILASKVITGIAYSLLGSETLRKVLTVQNIHRVATVVGRSATTTGRTIKGTASKARVAVQQRKEEIKRAKSDRDSLI